MTKQNRFADKAQNQAEIGGRAIRLPAGGKVLRQWAARIEEQLAENDGEPPAHWVHLTGATAAVIRAKGLS
jgi:hypothetical protein